MKIDLKNQKCQACTGDTLKFDEKQIIKYLSKLDNWSVNEEQKMIFKKLKFKNFNEALNFTNQVAHFAEEEAHHPDISLGWGYTLIMLHTHSIKGLSLNDFILAAKIDTID